MTVSIAAAAAAAAAPAVSNRAYRDAAFSKPTFPYISFGVEPADTPSLMGDGQTLARIRLVQIDLWQRTKDESEDLKNTIIGLLDGAQLANTGQHVYVCRFSDCQRVPDPDDNIVHHAITLRVTHSP